MRLNSVLKFLFARKTENEEDELLVRDFMKPRCEVEFIKISDSLATICKKFSYGNDLVLPVMIDNYDVIGVLHMSALIPNKMMDDDQKTQENVHEEWKPAYLVNMNDRIDYDDELLITNNEWKSDNVFDDKGKEQRTLLTSNNQWQNYLIPIASIIENAGIRRLFKLWKRYELIVCVDEHGSCSGIITKRIFTESILDKFALSDQIESKDLIVNGDTYLNEINIDFSKYIDVNDETVSSFVIGLFNKIPEKGEFITIGPYKIEVLSASGGYVKKVCIYYQK